MTSTNSVVISFESLQVLRLMKIKAKQKGKSIEMGQIVERNLRKDPEFIATLKEIKKI